MDALTYKETTAWERLLEKTSDALSAVSSGGKVAFLAKEELVDPSRAEMIVWKRNGKGIVVHKQAFQGFRYCDADIILVATSDLLTNLCTNVQGDTMRTIRQAIRRGDVVCYFLRSKRELIDMGYEEFVELLGLPLAGCQ